MTSYNGFLMTVKDMGQPVIGRDRPAAIDEMTAIKKMTDQSGGKTLEEVKTKHSKGNDSDGAKEERKTIAGNKNARGGRYIIHANISPKSNNCNSSIRI